MRFKRVFDIDERFTTRYSKEDHHRRHVVKNKEYPPITASEYERIADELALTPVDHKTILGYETTAPEGDSRVRYAKYNKLTGDFVVYGYKGNEPMIISLHKKTLRQFNIDKTVKYLGEIPDGK